MAKQRETVIERFVVGNIPKDVYDISRKKLDKDIDGITIEILKLENNSSNPVKNVHRLIITSCILSDLWKYGSFEGRQKIQKLAFPDGVIWNKQNGIPRTITENSVLSLFRCMSITYEEGNEGVDTKKEAKSADFTSLVAEGGLEPPTFGL